MLFSFSCQQTQKLPPIQRGTAGGDFTPSEGVVIGRLRRPGRAGVHRRECRRLAAETKGDRTPSMVSCPLLTPLTFLCADTSEMCSETGVRGLGSVRRADFGTLLCPEFPLRYPPRITVRGQTVQRDNVPLRKAPLRSRMCPWSTRRPCGPLAFRRATEGSRVQRKGWGVKRGRETLVSLPLLPPPPGGGNAHAISWRTSPVPGGPLSPPAASRCIGGRSTVSRRLKSNGLLPQKSKNLPVSREVLNIYVSNRISVFRAALSVQYACRAAAS